MSTGPTGSAEAASFELKTKVTLAQKSQLLVDKFIRDHRELKEVDTHDVYLLLAKAAGMMAAMSLDDGSLLDENAQRQLLLHLFDVLCKDEANDFEADVRIGDVLDTIFKLKKGEFEINLGKKGWGCFPCFGNVKVAINE